MLSLVFIVMGTVFAAPEIFATPDGTNIPLIHIMGTGQEIFRKDENGNEQKVFPIQIPFTENVREQMENGIEVSNIVKYGLQSVPLTKSSDELADGTVTVFESSFGATVALTEETLSDEYIENAIQTGNGKYISPDKQIDASTCILPERTWFIKDLGHKVFPSCVNGLVSDIINNEGFTVYSSPEYPQYLVCDVESNTLTPMTEENMNTTDRWNVTFFEALKAFIENLSKLIKVLTAK